MKMIKVFAHLHNGIKETQLEGKKHQSKFIMEIINNSNIY